MLARMQCDEAQGYLFARPMEADRFQGWYTASGTLWSKAAA
jgi:EAL domain-containing protein (putative c-di-GMP-specific phosphodiesterase class I)